MSYNSKKNNVTIAITYANYTFNSLTPDDLKTELNGKFHLFYNIQKPNDINEVLSNLESLSLSYDNNTPYISGFLNFQPINNIYLHSSSIGNYNSLSCDGSQTVIKNTCFRWFWNCYSRPNSII